MYQLVKSPIPSLESTTVKRLADNAFIPFSPDNTDYQEFLRWCEQGNQPLPADEEQAQ